MAVGPTVNVSRNLLVFVETFPVGTRQIGQKGNVHADKDLCHKEIPPSHFANIGYPKDSGCPLASFVGRNPSPVSHPHTDRNPARHPSQRFLGRFAR